jgi:PAS domain S-box-containing protein
MSIRLKLTIMFLAVASIPLLFVSALTYTNYKNSLETNRLSNLQDIAAFKADKIETYFAGLKTDIRVAQEFSSIKQNLPVLNRFASEPENPAFLASKKILDEQLRPKQAILKLADIMLTNPQGRVVYSSNPEHRPKDFLKFLPDPQQKAIEEGKKRISFSDVFMNKAEGNRFVMLVTAPAFDSNGAFIGVIALEVDMAPVYELVQDTTGLGDTGETLVGKKTGDQVVFLNPLRHDPEAALKRRINTGEEIGLGIQEAAQGKKGAGQFLDYRGKNVIGAWRYIPSLDWGMVAKIDAREAFADVIKLRNLSLVILAIVLVLSGIMAFSIARSISEPIKRLSKGAEIVGSGNLDYKIGTDQKDEIGQLSRSFDNMTRDLKAITASRDELNREITERKRAEGLLSENEARLKRSQEIAHLGSWELDLVNNSLTWSDEVYRIFGLQPQEFGATYEAFLEAVHPDDRAAVNEAYSGSLREGRDAYEIEHRVLRKSTGEIRSVHEKCQHFRDETGRIIRSVGMVHDITGRKRAEEALVRAKEEWERTFDTVPDLIAILDDHHRILRVNRAMAQKLGREPEQCVGLPCYKYVHGLSAPPAFCPHTCTVKDGRQHIEEVYEERLGGHFLVSTTPMLDERGAVIGSVHVARDITERKAAEEKIKTLNDELRRHVLDLETANRELEAFSYSVSHDLRAPLRSIDGFSLALLEDYAGKLDVEGKDYLDRVRSATQRMAQLIDDLLKLSRVSRYEMKRERLDLSAVATQIAGRLRNSRPERAAEFNVADDLVAYGDDRLLTIVLENLFANAWKFTAKKPQTVIEFGATLLDGNAAYFVRDNGAGFDMAYADKLFNPFQRLHRETEFPGTGVGLATVKRIVNRHGGRVWIEGAVEKGTTVFFTLG